MTLNYIYKETPCYCIGQIVNSAETEMDRHVRRLLQRTHWLTQSDMQAGMIYFWTQTKDGGRLPANEIQNATQGGVDEADPRILF